jgi:hypothetical protein
MKGPTVNFYGIMEFHCSPYKVRGSGGWLLAHQMHWLFTYFLINSIKKFDRVHFTDVLDIIRETVKAPSNYI